MLGGQDVDLRKFIRYRVEAGKRGLFSRPADDWSVTVARDGICITHIDFRPFFAKGVSKHQIAWLDIEQVFAGQTDNFTWDTIWLTFVLSNGTSCTVPETATGWDRMLEQIPANLPKALHKEDWLPQVTRTAFEPNIMQLYPVPT